MRHQIAWVENASMENMAQILRGGKRGSGKRSADSQGCNTREKVTEYKNSIKRHMQVRITILDHSSLICLVDQPFVLLDLFVFQCHHSISNYQLSTVDLPGRRCMSVKQAT